MLTGEKLKTISVVCPSDIVISTINGSMEMKGIKFRVEALALGEDGKLYIWNLTDAARGVTTVMAPPDSIKVFNLRKTEGLDSIGPKRRGLWTMIPNLKRRSVSIVSKDRKLAEVTGQSVKHYEFEIKHSSYHEDSVQEDMVDAFLDKSNTLIIRGLLNVVTKDEDDEAKTSSKNKFCHQAVLFSELGTVYRQMKIEQRHYTYKDFRFSLTYGTLETDDFMYEIESEGKKWGTGSDEKSTTLTWHGKNSDGKQYVLNEGAASVRHMEVTPDGLHLVCAINRRLYFFRIADGRLLGKLTLSENITLMKISPDGWYILCVLPNEGLVSLLISDPECPDHEERFNIVREMSQDKISNKPDVIVPQSSDFTEQFHDIKEEEDDEEDIIIGELFTESDITRNLQLNRYREPSKALFAKQEYKDGTLQSQYCNIL